MADKKFIMLSLEEKETKKIANVIGSETCRKILDFLATKEATATELSEKLSIPLSTVTYNIQQLVDTGLVSADEFHYSQKGKEVLHYKLANKYIVISPRAVVGLRDKLKKILPVAAISAGAAGIVQLVHQYFSLGQYGDSLGTAPMMYAQEGAAQTAPVAMMKTADASLMMAQDSFAASVPIAPMVESFPFDIALWFFLGALCGIIVYVAVSLLNKEE